MRVASLAVRATGETREAGRVVAALLGSVDSRVAPRLRGDVHLLAGRLRRGDADLQGAARHFFEARGLYESAGDDARLGRALLQLAEVYREHDQVDLAVETARRAELEGARALHGKAPSPAVRLGALRIEGRILEQVGDLAGAERLYRRVRDAFLDAGIVLESALVALDLATVLVIGGRYSEARHVGTWLGLVIARHGLSRSAHAAALLFREAVGVGRPAPEEALRHLAAVRAELRRV